MWYDETFIINITNKITYETNLAKRTILKDHITFSCFERLRWQPLDQPVFLESSTVWLLNHTTLPSNIQDYDICREFPISRLPEVTDTFYQNISNALYGISDELREFESDSSLLVLINRNIGLTLNINNVLSPGTLLLFTLIYVTEWKKAVLYMYLFGIFNYFTIENLQDCQVK